jgi:miniconductance mechanosensitive channel
MFESGGRRIKRTLRIDATCVRFLTGEETARLKQFRLLHDYLEEKQLEVDQANKNLGELASEPANRRRLTNIGTFRAYGLAYLQRHPEIRQDMAMMVRMMEPQSEGIPVEVYCFTAVTAWTQYERIQGDVFDHLLSILPEMGLRLYQAPSGADMSGLVSRATGGSAIGAIGASSAIGPSAMGGADSGRLRGEFPTL